MLLARSGRSTTPTSSCWSSTPTQGATDQDAAIAGEADRAGRGIVIVANKWDLMKERGPDFVEDVRRGAAAADEVPRLRADPAHLGARPASARRKLLETIDKVAAARRKRVPTRALNKFLEAVTAANPPVSPGRRHVRILYAAQIGVAPPSFVFFTNVATTFHFSYERFLVNQLREEFGFEGTPIRQSKVRRRNKSKRAGTGKSYVVGGARLTTAVLLLDDPC